MLNYRKTQIHFTECPRFNLGINLFKQDCFYQLSKILVNLYQESCNLSLQSFVVLPVLTDCFHPAKSPGGVQDRRLRDIPVLFRHKVITDIRCELFVELGDPVRVTHAICELVNLLLKLI